MIGDVAAFRRTGVAGRRIAELEIPVEAWRAAMCHAARCDGARVRTFVVPSTVTTPDDRHGRMVFAVRVDPPPDPYAETAGHVRWWRVDELGMPFRRWRTALHRIARRERARVHTFLVPPAGADRDGPDQLVYLVWTDADAATPVAVTPPPPVGAPRPVTDLARYAAVRHASDSGRRDADGTERS